VTATGVGSNERVGRRLGQAFREFRFVFGDDEMAEVDSFDGSVPQALLLWNGELTNLGARAEPGGTLASILEAHLGPARRMDGLFLAVYSRVPTAAETAALLPQVRAGNRQRWEDLFFALLTSTEAITNH